MPLIGFRADSLGYDEAGNWVNLHSASLSSKSLQLSSGEVGSGALPYYVSLNSKGLKIEDINSDVAGYSQITKVGTNKILIKGNTTNSNAFDSENPRIEFSNADGSRRTQLLFNAPSNILTLLSNQKAPLFCVTIGSLRPATSVESVLLGSFGNGALPTLGFMYSSGGTAIGYALKP